MKKLLIAISFVLCLGFAPVAFAQTVNIDQQAITQQLIQDLLQLIQMLEDQINAINAAQVVPSEQIPSLQNTTSPSVSDGQIGEASNLLIQPTCTLSVVQGTDINGNPNVLVSWTSTDALSGNLYDSLSENSSRQVLTQYGYFKEIQSINPVASGSVTFGNLNDYTTSTWYATFTGDGGTVNCCTRKDNTPCS